MSSFFNESEFEDSGGSDDELLAATVDFEEEEEVSQEEEADPTANLAAVEKRLEIATLLKTFLDAPLFQQRTEAGNYVERKIQNFVREEMETLLGMRAPQKQVVVKSDFTPEQADVLRQFADRTLTKMGETVVPREVKPVPVIAQRAAPVSKPVVQLRAPQPVAAPAPAPKKPAAKPVTKPTPKPAENKPATPAKKGQKKLLSAVATENGEKITTIQTETGRVLRQTKDADGNVIATNDLTPQVRSPTSIPMPTGAALTSALMTASQNAVADRGLAITISTVTNENAAYEP